MTLIEGLRGTPKSVVFSASATSTAVDLAPGRAFAIYVPTGFNGTTLTLQVKVGDGTYKEIDFDDLPFTVTANKVNQVPAAVFPLVGAELVKFKSDQSETLTCELFYTT